MSFQYQIVDKSMKHQLFSDELVYSSVQLLHHFYLLLLRSCFSHWPLLLTVCSNSFKFQSHHFCSGFFFFPSKDKIGHLSSETTQLRSFWSGTPISRTTSFISATLNCYKYDFITPFSALPPLRFDSGNYNYFGTKGSNRPTLSVSIGY